MSNILDLISSVNTAYGYLLYSVQVRGTTTSSELGGPVSWSRVLLPFYRKKLERSTQFGAIG